MNYDINNCQLGVPTPKAHSGEGAPKAWPTTSAHAIRSKVYLLPSVRLLVVRVQSHASGFQRLKQQSSSSQDLEP